MVRVRITITSPAPAAGGDKQAVLPANWLQDKRKPGAAAVKVMSSRWQGQTAALAGRGKQRK
jgi:hypothetical protein